MSKIADNSDLRVVEHRLSLDLSEDHHEMIKEISTLCGFSTKTEAIRNFVQFYYEAAGLVLDGNEIVGFKRGTGEVTPIYGTALSTLARRVRQRSSTATVSNGASTPPPATKVA